MHTTEVVLFDASGTLFFLPKGVGWHYADVAGRYGFELNPKAVDVAFHRAWKAVLAPAETPGPRPDDDRGWWQDLVDVVLDNVGAPKLKRDAFFAELWLEFTRPGVWELFPDALEVVSAVAQRCRVGVVSNFDSRLRPILAGLGLTPFFDHVLVSSEVGAEKPSRRMFAEAAARFGVQPEQMLHVGDEPEADWQGAAAAGMRVFELQRPERSLRDLLAVL